VGEEIKDIMHNNHFKKYPRIR